MFKELWLSKVWSSRYFKDCSALNLPHFVTFPSLFCIHNSLPIWKKSGFCSLFSHFSVQNETHRVNNFLWVLMTPIAGGSQEDQITGRSTSEVKQNSFRPNLHSCINLRTHSQAPARRDENAAPNSSHMPQTKRYEWSTAPRPTLFPSSPTHLTLDQPAWFSLRLVSPVEAGRGAVPAKTLRSSSRRGQAREVDGSMCWKAQKCSTHVLLSGKKAEGGGCEERGSTVPLFHVTRASRGACCSQREARKAFWMF